MPDAIDESTRDQEALELLVQALALRYSEKGIPAALRLMRSLDKRIALFTAFVTDRAQADAMAAQQIRLHLACAPRAAAGWAAQSLDEAQRRLDDRTLELLVGELRLLHRLHGLAAMLRSDPVFSLMAVDGSEAGPDPVGANRSASEKLRRYLLGLQAARLAMGPDWDRRDADDLVHRGSAPSAL